MHIREITDLNYSTLESIQKLLDQLSAEKIFLKTEALKKQLSSGNSHLFIAEKNSAILGMLTLTIYQIPSGLQARIDDLVVDEKARGQGVGTELMNQAIRESRKLDVRHISLTSHPRRAAANRLYQQLGFKQYQTNVFILDCK